MSPRTILLSALGLQIKAMPSLSMLTIQTQVLKLVQQALQLLNHHQSPGNLPLVSQLMHTKKIKENEEEVRGSTGRINYDHNWIK